MKYDSDDVLKEKLDDEDLEDSYLLSDYILNLLEMTNELRIWVKIGDKDRVREELERIDKMLIEMRYGQWELIDRGE